MTIGDLNPAIWRIDVYELSPQTSLGGVITDLSNLYTSDLSISKQRNYPDEIRFTLDLQQLEERAKSLNIQSREIVQPYRHKVRCYRNNKFMAQGIVTKTSANLNNQSKNTIEVQCVDTLGLLEKRLIHQDYGEGSWADFAKEVIFDAQHEPNRIYNYAWEGDGVSVDNAWFRGWKFAPGEDTLRDFPEWEPNHLYSMYDTCTHNAKFWEAKEHAFYSGETFSESNWTLLGILDEETGDVSAAYGVWREDEEEPGPTGTALGGWGGTSSCHMTAQSFGVNNGGSVTSISMRGSTVSTSLVAPYEADDDAIRIPSEYQEVEYLESVYGTVEQAELGPYIDTGINLKRYNSRLKITTDFKFNDTVAEHPHWRVVYGAAQGVNPSTGNWSWNPQFNLASNEYGMFVSEYPISSGTDGGTGIITTQVTISNDRQTIVHDCLPDTPTLTINDQIYYGGTSVQNSSEYGPNANLTVFARNYANPESSEDVHKVGSYCAPVKIYSMKIEYAHGVLREFIPCYRKSDSLPGFYDTQNGKFYPSTGTGRLNVGPDISHDNAGTDFIHTRVMSRNVLNSTSQIQLYLEGYGENKKIWSPTLNIPSSGWHALEYDFPVPPFAVYRFGIKILTGEILCDTPLVYLKPKDGDAWDLGLTIGEFPTDEEQEEAGWGKNRITPTYQWKKAKATLYDLSNMDSDNFWYEIDKEGRFNVWINRGSKTVDINLSYPKNITSMEVITNADNLVNYLKGDGSADVKQDPLVSGTTNDNGAPFTWIEQDEKSMSDYWALAEAISYDSERTIETLRNDLLSELSARKTLQDVPTIKISNNAITPDQFGLGDIISVEAIDIPFVQPVNGLYKIMGYDIRVSINGDESISLTVLNPNENQINDLSFPQLIKNLIDRLHGAR